MAFRIAIADDDLASSRPSYERLLDDKAFDKPIYIDTLNAFNSCHFERFDAVLLDVNLDQWDFTLAEAVNTIGKHCPVVLVSAQWDKDGRTEDRIRQVMPLAKETEFIQVLILNDLSEKGWERRLFAIRSQLKLAVARHRRQGSLDLDAGDTVYILHLSDPQYGDDGQDGWACMSEVEIVKQVKKTVPDIHFLAITGDITFDGKPTDFQKASRKIGLLLEAFLPKVEDRHERLLLVPGNHDVNLKLTAADRVSFNFETNSIVESKKGAISSELRHFGLQPFRNFAWQLTQDQRWIEPSDLSWFSDSFRHLGLRFFFINSVANLDCDNPSMANVGTGTSDTFSDAALASDKLFGIALSHHGRESFQECGVEAWAQVSKIVQTCGIKLWLHGHGHARMVERLAIGDGSSIAVQAGALENNQVLTVMAPTTHLKEGKKLRPVGERRGFNVIRIDRTNHHVRNVTVTTYRMSDEKPEQIDPNVEVPIPF